jgi:glycosyltransferase involved in cell wall biosynthesis
MHDRRSMTILVINWQDWENTYAGGAEVYLYEIFSRVARRGHRVVLLASRAEGQKRYEERDWFEIYRVGKRNNFNFHVPYALRLLLRKYPVDVVIDDLNKIPFYSPLFTRKKVVPMIMHLFRHAIYREADPLSASYVFLTERIIPFCYPRSQFVAISRSTAEDLEAIGVRNKIHIVHSGVLPARFHQHYRRQRDLVVYVGRIKKYKSIDHFIEAVRLIRKSKKVRAMIVGDGDARQSLMDYAAKRGVEMTFTGFVSEQEKYRIYHEARVVVQTSMKEGWGLTTIEAQSLGTPVVCADAPGLREAVVNGRTGYLYPYGDVKALADRIMILLDSDATWRRFARAAIRWADTFSWDGSARKLEKILKQIVYTEQVSAQ